MNKTNWRDELDLVVEQNLKELINESKKFDHAIRESNNPSKAQIWVALAIMNEKINKLDIKKRASNSKIPKKELDKILKTLENL